MDPFAAYSGDADGLYERVVNHVVVNGGLVPRSLGPDLLAGVLPGGRDALVVRWSDTLPDLRSILGDASGRGIEVALVGGPPDALEILKDAVPITSTGGVWAWHVPELGEPVRVAGNGGTLGLFLIPPHGPPHWRTFQRAARTSALASHAELTSFQAIVGGRRTPATTTLLVVIGLMYGLEVWRLAPEGGPAMLALGALNRDRVLHGELWRLVSSTFLHGNLMHLAFNGFVLYSLGTTLERLLGTPRFVVLYTASALGGSLLSLVFLTGMSVGASGALWGLMTATFLLAVRDDGFLPEQVRAGLKRGAGQNLILNILVSFQPGVDWAAHAGGGLTGAVLVLLGVVTWGLPTWASGTGRSADAVPAFVRGAAIASALVLAIGLGVGLVAGRFGAPSP